MAFTTVNYLEGSQYDARSDRLLTGGLIITPGVDSHRSLAVTATTTPSMKLNVSSGSAFVRGDTVANQGTYFAYNDGNITIDIDAADQTNNRIDLVSLVIQDAFYSGVNPSKASIVVTKGAATASPYAPIGPPNSIDLATVLVKKKVTAIGNADIQKLTPRATSLGGIAYVKSYLELTEGLPKIDGLHAYRKDIDRLMRCDGNKWEYINTKPAFDTGWQNIAVKSEYQARKTQYRVYGDMVFTRGAIRGIQYDAKNAEKFINVASLPSAYGPNSIMQVLSGLNSQTNQGIEYRERGDMHLFYSKPTRAWCIIGTSWLLG